MFSMLLKFLSLTIKTRSVYGNKNASSVGKIYPLFSLNQRFSKWVESPPRIRF